MKMKKTLIILVFFFTLLLVGCDSTIGISVGAKKQEMYVGEELLLQVNIDDMTDDVTWTSTDDTIATVDSEGLVTALKAGYTYITATSKINSEEVSSKVYLIVKEKSGGATIEEVEKTLSISGNQTIALTSSVSSTLILKATVTNEEDGDEIVWSSSDPEIATVTQDGLVTGVKIGVVTISAHLKDDENVSDSMPIIVRTADGVQNVIKKYIETTTYVVDGDIDLTSLNNKVVNMVSTYADSIIGISNYQYSTTIRGGKSSTLSLSSVGSGVIYKKETVEGGYKYTVLTNNHVTEDADQLKAYLGDLDEEVDATLVRADEDVDLAIVTFVSSRDYTVIEFEEVDNYSTGDFVVAVGCPTGYEYYGSVTFGVISYKNRTLSGESAIFLQHDAAINPGNSGGALLNLDGKLIGINTLKIATTEVEGMGFAVSMTTIMEFLGETSNN